MFSISRPKVGVAHDSTNQCSTAMERTKLTPRLPRIRGRQNTYVSSCSCFATPTSGGLSGAAFEEGLSQVGRLHVCHIVDSSTTTLADTS